MYYLLNAFLLFLLPFACFCDDDPSSPPPTASPQGEPEECYYQDFGSIEAQPVPFKDGLFAFSSDVPWNCTIKCGLFIGTSEWPTLELVHNDETTVLGTFPENDFNPCHGTYTMPYPGTSRVLFNFYYHDMEVTCTCLSGVASPPTASPLEPPEECFSGETLVHVAGVKGLVSMKHLQVGDAVLTKSGAYKPMYAYGRILDNHPTLFRQIYTTAMSKPLEITSDHMVFVAGKAGPIRAGTVQVGDFLLGATKNDLHEVVKIKQIVRNEIFFPLTTDGTIVTNGIASSTYTDDQGSGNEYFVLAGLELPFTKAFLAHVWYSPLRLWCFGVSSGPCHHQDKDGFNSWDALGDSLVKFAENQSGFLMQLIVYSLIMIVPVITMSIELLVGPSFGPLVLSMVAVVAWKRSKDYRKKKVD